MKYAKYGTIIIWLLKISSHVTHEVSVSTEFSGLYFPTTTYNQELYAASWLISKYRFCNSADLMHSIRDNDRNALEKTTQKILYHDCANCTNSMSRDYFDFMVEHLSSTPNTIPNDKIHDVILSRLIRKSVWLRDKAKHHFSSLGIDERNYLNQTVVLVPFSALQASARFSAVQVNEKDAAAIRFAFLNATISSLSHYFQNIVIFVFSKTEFDLLSSYEYPIWKIINLSETYKFRNQKLIPKHTLLRAKELLQSDPEWSSIRYIYFTECDQLLHFRQIASVYEAIIGSGESLAVVPHRMQTLLLPQDFPPELTKLWDPDLAAGLSRIELIQQNDSVASGSCCDHGRFVFRKCGAQWWYNCKDWGMRNHTHWIKFGEDGYTMPLGTEHQARCKYSASHQKCPIPTSCSSDDRHHVICGEIPNVEKR